MALQTLDLAGTVIKRAEATGTWKASFEGNTFFKGDRSGQVGHSNQKFVLDATQTPKRIT